jgi:hypothetical protein
MAMTELSAQLALLLNGQLYLVEELTPEPGERKRLGMAKPGQKTPYLVVQADEGDWCTCEGFARWRKLCKHLRGARMVNLFVQPERVV